MTLEQYSTFIDILPQIEAVLKKQGADVPRPVFNDAAGAGGEEDVDENAPAEGEEEEEEGEAKKTAKKSVNDKRSNIEATSDEDEDD